MSKSYFHFGCFLLLLQVLLFQPNLNAQSTLNLYQSNKTVTYEECVAYYSNLVSKQIRIEEVSVVRNLSDGGNRLHLFKISSKIEPTNTSKVKILINNNIHAGEPAGVDACIKLVHELNEGLVSSNLLSHVDLYIIPAYNVDGMKRRNSYSRANQNGPEEYGFRPSACNYDLNRDMVKGDSKNTFFLREVFNFLQPHLFIDTHISDGADYSYTMTLISTLTQQLPLALQAMMQDSLLPELYRGMKEQGDEICPYVDTPKSTPDSGIVAFNDIARFTTGYAALHNCLGFVTESHMLKPYPKQVESTLRMLKEFMLAANHHASGILAAKEKADQEVSKQKEFHLEWKPDYAKCDSIIFKGYSAGYKKSEVTGLPILYYDSSAPYSKMVPFYRYYNSVLKASAPNYFIVGQEWGKVIEQLKSSGVLMHQADKDFSVNCSAKYLRNVEWAKAPYEGHFVHRSVTTDTITMLLPVKKGDFLIPMNQALNAYIMQVLLPESPDSYFRWNYFDPVLQQKEWFSDYVFDQTAKNLLAQNPELRKKLDRHVKEKKLEQNAWEQLLFIYRNSNYYESSHLRYPVFGTNIDLSMYLKK